MAAAAPEVQPGSSQLQQALQLAMAQATGQNTCISTHNVRKARAGVRIWTDRITNSFKKVIH
eukprot:2841782-Karenia_brevis.AAC.1